MSGPFPRDKLQRIRQYPGNNKCCDCESLDIDWGNINHGTLHCLDCAGKHRGFGVHVSFMRSIYMDTWSEEQVDFVLLFYEHNILVCFMESNLTSQ